MGNSWRYLWGCINFIQTTSSRLKSKTCRYTGITSLNVTLWVAHGAFMLRFHKRKKNYCRALYYSTADILTSLFPWTDYYYYYLCFYFGIICIVIVVNIISIINVIISLLLYFVNTKFTSPGAKVDKSKYYVFQEKIFFLISTNNMYLL